MRRGEGTSFCAGDDLAPEDRFKYGPPDMHTRLKIGYPRLVNDIVQMRKPVIAMVRGYAVRPSAPSRMPAARASVATPSRASNGW